MLRLVAEEGFDDGERAKLLREIRTKCGEDMAIDIEIVDEIPLAGSGKRRFVVSKVSPFLSEDA